VQSHFDSLGAKAMTKRTPWPIANPAGTKHVGTGRVREDRTVGRSFAEREIMLLNGRQPHSTFDEVADGIDGAAAASARSAARRHEDVKGVPTHMYRSSATDEGGSQH
jgi:hypothetical protein